MVNGFCKVAAHYVSHYEMPETAKRIGVSWP
jgi:hypothetical protein